MLPSACTNTWHQGPGLGSPGIPFLLLRPPHVRWQAQLSVVTSHLHEIKITPHKNGAGRSSRETAGTGQPPIPGKASAGTWRAAVSASPLGASITNSMGLACDGS